MTAQPKPVFVSKRDRAKLLEEQQQSERAAEEARIKAVILNREQFLASLDRERSRETEKPREPQAVVSQEELGAIKVGLAEQAVYIEGKKDKKKPPKPSEKFHSAPKFEWDASDDTSADPNSLAGQRIEYRPLFGKGFVGGIDVAEQAREASKYSKIVSDFETTSRSASTAAPSEQPAPQKQPGGSFARPGRFVSRYTDIGASKQWLTKSYEDMTERDWKIFREDNDIRVIYGKAPHPIREFGDGELNTRIVDNIKSAGYKKPTPIQMQAIPMGLARKDMIGIAPTGSGKSAAFLVPLIDYLIPLMRSSRENPELGPHAVVVSPTRELALQIQQEFEKLSKGIGMRSAALIGGHTIGDQEDVLNMGVDVVFGTPGRIKDLLDKYLMVLDRVNYVVLDEADLVIDLGLEADLNGILAAIPRTNLKSMLKEVAAEQEAQAASRGAPYRTTHMFSATMPQSLKMIAQK